MVKMAGRNNAGKLMPSPFKFAPHGKSGIEVSEIYPELASCIDDLCVLRAVHGTVFDTPALNDAECAPELRGAWRRLQQTMETSAESITFQQLLDESTAKEKMYYI